MQTFWWMTFALLAQTNQPAGASASPTKSEILLNWLNNNPITGWGMAIFAVVAMATAAITAWTGNLSKLIDFWRKYLPAKPKITDEDYQRLRQKLIGFQQTAVATRLEDSLHNQIRIDLERQEQRQRVGRAQATLVPEDPAPKRSFTNLLNRRWKLLNRSQSTEPLAPTQPTLDLFERADINGRLLILGEPGSGKTTELLGLAEALLNQASDDTDPKSFIPVIFELSAWTNEQSIADWLAAQLQETYQISPVITQHWIENEQLLPLLDGLDELGLTNQRLCIKAINQFLAEHRSLAAVVCCRREEYEQGEAQLAELQGAILLQPITEPQIQAYLQDLNRASLWENLQHQPDLLQLARLPLFLTMLIVAYQGQPIRTPADLFDAYIQKQLHDSSHQGAYPPSKQAPSPERTRHYLGWLADRLEREKQQPEFLIERLQPSWLILRPEEKLYQLIVALSVGSSTGLISGIGVGLFSGVVAGISVGISLGLLGGLLPLEELHKIEIPEKLTWSWQKFVGPGLIFALIADLSAALIVGLILGLIVGLISGPTVGLITGLIFGPISGIMTSLMNGLSGVELEVREKIKPNQGLALSCKNGLIFGLISGLTGGAIIGLIVGLISGPTVGLITGLIFGMMGMLLDGLRGGLQAALQHFVLRLVLYRYDYAPWNYARFLDHAARHRFIQRVGGRYRFMHDLLRKHFAAMYSDSQTF